MKNAEVGYTYQPDPGEMTHEAGADLLRRRLEGWNIKDGWVPAIDRSAVDRTIEGLREIDLPTAPLALSLAGLADFEERADYRGRYAAYYSATQTEKRFEHFVAASLLDLKPNQVFIDVASEGSPLPEIGSRVFQCDSYAQDIMYPPGIHDRRIGGDACELPLPDESVDAVSLTCSLEHFEDDSDIRLFRELGRVLRTGGRVVVVPLYMFPISAIQTDPKYSAREAVPFDRGATIYLAENWKNRHGRYYSPDSFKRRVIDSAGAWFQFRVFEICEPFVTDCEDATIYARFALLAERVRRV